MEHDTKETPEAIDTWCVRGPLTDAATTNAQVEQLATASRHPSVEDVDPRARLSWTAACSGFKWSLAFQGTRMCEGVLLGWAPPFREVVLEGRWVHQCEMVQRRRGGLAWRMPQCASPDERFEPTLLLRRDTHGRTIDDFLATCRQRAEAQLQALNVSVAAVAELPNELVEAVLRAVATDESGRVLEKLRIKPALLVALGVMLGSSSEVWVPDGHLTGPLDAIRAGAKERVVLQTALELHERLRELGALRTGLANVPLLDRDSLVGPMSPLAYAKVLRERPIPLDLASDMWRTGAPPTLIPDDPAKRSTWVTTLYVCRPSCRTPRSLRYAVRHGVALHDLLDRPQGRFTLASPHAFFRELTDLNGLGSTRLCSPRTIMKRSRAQPFLPIEGIQDVMEIDSFVIRRMTNTDAIRALGRQYRNCLAEFERYQVRQSTLAHAAYFEVVWSGGACVTSLTAPPDSKHTPWPTEDIEVRSRGPSNEDVPSEVAARIERALRNLFTSTRAAPSALRGQVPT